MDFIGKKMKKIIFREKALEQYEYWRDNNPRIAIKINSLLEDIKQHPFVGIGKPEPLKGNYAGFWSRRITEEHRLIYKIVDNTIFVAKCMNHY